MKPSRHLDREIAMKAFFTWDFRTGDEEKKTLAAYADDVIQEFFADYVKTPFFESLVTGMEKEYEKIAGTITTFAPEWPIDKINSIDKAILWVGTYEMLYEQDVPPVVIINEAIETSKKYGNENSSKFINGVLNSMYKLTREQPDTDANKTTQHTGS